MLNNYQMMKDNPEPPTLSDVNKEVVGRYLWDNFNKNFKAENNVSSELLSTFLRRAIYDQGGNFQNAPSQMLTYMSAQDLQFYCTHIYVWIQLSEMLQNAYQGQNYLDDFTTSPYFTKAFDQANPYILRYHVFALHNRMHAMMTTEKNPTDKEWKAKRDAIYAEALRTGKKISDLIPKHPAFAHFLSGYCHYTLAMGADSEHVTKHWESAYTEFLWSEASEKKSPRASFIVNLGQGLYKDMPYENLEEVKQQIGQVLGPEKCNALALTLNKRLTNK